MTVGRVITTAGIKVKVNEAYELLISRHSGMARVNKGSHRMTLPPTRLSTNRMPTFNAYLQSIAVLWLVLISHPAEGRRLSWPGWLGEILR